VTHDELAVGHVVAPDDHLDLHLAMGEGAHVRRHDVEPAHRDVLRRHLVPWGGRTHIDDDLDAAGRHDAPLEVLGPDHALPVSSGEQSRHPTRDVAAHGLGRDVASSLSRSMAT